MKITIDRSLVEQALEALEADNSKLWPSDRRTAAYFNLRAALRLPVLNPAPGYCKHCKQYTIEEPLPAEPVQEPDKSEQGRTRSAILGNNVEAMMETGLSFMEALDTTLKVYDHPPKQPVAKVDLMTTGGNAGLATRIVEIDDHLRERLRPGQLLYTAPPTEKTTGNLVHIKLNIMRTALENIAGIRPIVDNLLSDKDIALTALERINSYEQRKN